MNGEIQGFNLTPQNLSEAQQYASLIAESDMVPQDYKGKPGNVLVAVQMGGEVGLNPMQSLQNIAVINGRPSIWGDALIALVRASPECEYVKEEVKRDSSGNPMYAECRVKRRGEDEAVRTFSVDEAQKAGLWGKQGPWQSYPSRMLQMRARAFALRDVFTDILKGLHVAEEVQDIKEVGPAEPASGKGNPVASINEQVRQESGGEQPTETPAVEHQEADTVPGGNPIDQALSIIENAQQPKDLMPALDLKPQLTEQEVAVVRQAYQTRKSELEGETNPAAGALQ